MKKLILLLFLIVPLFAQNDSWNKWDSRTSQDGATIVFVSILSIADNSTDSLDAIGSVSSSGVVDSTFWLFRAAALPTLSTYDVLDKFNDWQSAWTEAHSQSANGTVYMGLAVVDTAGDTSAIYTRAHNITAFTEVFPYTFPLTF